ncbi:MAG: TolC family protein, partial [Duncaniella sp.]|nr:TolC family protein [Duncaniella sp.]
MKLRTLISLPLIVLSLAAQGQPLTLTSAECRRMALDTSRQMKRADNDLAIARTDVAVATTNYLPRLDSTGGLEYMFPDMDMMVAKLQMHGMYLAGFQLTQPIYAGGKITAGRRLAKIGERASREQHRMTEAEVIGNADYAYWNYVSVLGKVRLMESYAAMMDTLM